MDTKSPRVVPCSKNLDGIRRHFGEWRDLGQCPAVRPSKPKRAIGPSIDLIALLVDSAVMPATQQREIRERRRTAVNPVPDVMSLAERKSAARKATAAIPMVERSP